MQSISSAVRICQPSSCSYVSRVALSTTVSSFFRETSGRSRRRRARHQRGQQHPPRRGGPQGRTADDRQRGPGSEVDTRTVSDLLFSDAKYEDGSSVPPHLRFTWPTSLAQWRAAFGRAWREYKSTWRGFFTSRGFLVEDDVSESARKEEEEARRGKMRQVGRDIKERAKRNVQLVKEEAELFRTQVRDASGIHSKDDLKRLVGEMLQLFSDCVKEFMAGYRKGRDDEVEKMLTEYFQELEKSANSSSSHRKRRKRKRREILVL